MQHNEQNKPALDAEQPASPLPAHMRRQIEQAIADSRKGMQLNDGKERVTLPGGTLARLLQIADAQPASPLPAGEVLTDDEWITLDLMTTSLNDNLNEALADEGVTEVSDMLQAQYSLLKKMARICRCDTSSKAEASSDECPHGVDDGACKECYEASSDAWQVMAAEAPYKRITELKTKSIIERDGYRVEGYILRKDEQICLSYGQAIRWMDCKALFNIMHCIEDSAPSAAPAQQEPVTDGVINDITMRKLGKWPSFEAQSWACKVVHAVLPIAPPAAQQEIDALRKALKDLAHVEHQKTQRIKELEESLNQYAAQRDAIIDKVNALLEEIGGFNELNESNYSHDDVSEINNWGVAVWERAEDVKAVLAGNPAPAQEAAPISDEEWIAFATEEQFLLFCDEEEFVDIARAIERRILGSAKTGEQE